ncbi:spindle assembly checkpoint component mad1-like [Lingula anatina]|uniref:Spindle assembly checkpoint component mad1-like n=1 Tax=Lingula anatina TaxID=7574 RepID=A0A1S3INV6_LINAN|nr:spindle assembly checkpoint component mad1-like [Lingula anatina]|eukprot:XP_013399887.1 spindle assembly checkpoint component mad1-like [Lingula anatina]
MLTSARMVAPSREPSSTSDHVAITSRPEAAIGRITRKLYSRTKLSQPELDLLSNTCQFEDVPALLEPNADEDVVDDPSQSKDRGDISEAFPKSQQKKLAQKKKVVPSPEENATGLLALTDILYRTDYSHMVHLKKKQCVPKRTKVTEYNLKDEEICVLKKYKSELVRELKICRDVMLHRARETITTDDEKMALTIDVDSLKILQTLMDRKYKELCDFKTTLCKETLLTLQKLDKMVATPLRWEIEKAGLGEIVMEQLESNMAALNALKVQKRHCEETIEEANRSLQKCAKSKFQAPIRSDLDKFIEKYKNKITEIEKEMAEVEQRVEKCRNSADLPKTGTDNKGSRAPAQNLMDKVQSLLSRTENNLDNLLKKLYDTIATHERTIADCRNTIAQHEGTISDLTTKNFELTNTLHNTQANLQETTRLWKLDQDKLAGCRSKIADQELNLESLIDHRAALMVEVGELKNTIKDREATIARMFEEINAMKKERYKLQVTVKEKECFISALQKERGDLRREILDRKSLVPLNLVKY